MKKATLTIVMMVEERPENLEALEELQQAVDSGELANAYDEEDGISASATFLVEDV